MKKILNYTLLLSSGIISIILVTSYFFRREREKNLLAYQIFSTETNYRAGFTKIGLSDKNYFDLKYSQILDSSKNLELTKSINNSTFRNIHLQLRGILHVLNTEEKKYLNQNKFLELLAPIYYTNVAVLTQKPNSFFESLIEQTANRFFGESLSFKNGFYSVQSTITHQYNELEKVAKNNGIELNPEYVGKVKLIIKGSNSGIPILLSYIFILSFWISFISVCFLWFKKRFSNH